MRHALTVLLALILARRPRSSPARHGEAERRPHHHRRCGLRRLRQLRRAGRQDAEHRQPREGRRPADRLLRERRNCTPTRAALITGRYQQRFGLERRSGAARSGLGSGLRPTGRSLPQLLKNNGYATASSASGTWATSRSSVPTRTGSTTSSASRAASSTTTSTRPATASTTCSRTTRRHSPAGYMTDLITERSVQFIERQRQPAVLPRGRLQRGALALTSGRISRRPRATTAASCSRTIDRRARARTTSRCSSAPTRASARSSRALDASGLTQNTLVIFTNDNGGEWLSRNAPLFHRKQTRLGRRHPRARHLQWPGQIPAGKPPRRSGSPWISRRRSWRSRVRRFPPRRARRDQPAAAAQGQAPRVERTLFFRYTLARRDGSARCDRGLEAAHRRRRIPMLFNLRTTSASGTTSRGSVRTSRAG